MTCLLIWSVRAEAEAARARLVLERPAQSFCPTSEAIASDLAALAGHPVFTSDPGATTLVRCDISEHASGVAARIEVRGADGVPFGTRELSAGPGECAALREPIAVVLLMLLDREPEPARPAERREAPSSLGFGASVGASLGVLPRADVGFGLALVPSLREHLHGRLDAGFWLPVTAQDAGQRGARFRAFSLGGALCPNLVEGLRAVEISLCAGVQLAVLQARPHHLEEDHRATRAMGQALVTLELSGHWRRSELKADLGPSLSFARPRFYLLQDDGARFDVHRPARAGAIFRLTLIIRAP